MRLKTLEIKGFKSFANDTLIHFDEDVIGIVGPNGSGKSNIVDAIRWVLGEQKSKELRLDKMHSVIFNGTKTRKPGQLAQVSLTFDNTKNLIPTEYQSVTITRILYQSGDSEYRLNNVTCRLKDISTLLLDTGIGSNSYAIIALGMVDDILSDKEHARRLMFEQAAGISKYKIRKHETLNKLESTTADLDRVEDLLFEINGNLQTLEKQAKRTQKYFDLKEQYKTLSIDLAILKIASHKNRYKELSVKIEKEEDHYRQLDTQYATIEAQIEFSKKENLDKEKTLSERQRELNQLVGRIRTIENDKRMFAQKKLFVEQNKEKLAHQISTSKARITQLNEDIKYYQTEVSQEKRVEARLEIQLVEAEEKLNAIRQSHGSLKSDLDVFMSNQQQIERQILELEKNKAINSNLLDNLEKDIEQSNTDVKARQEEISSLISNRDVVIQNEKTQQEKVLQLEKAEENRLQQVEQKERLLEELNRKLAEINRKLDARKNEFKLTKSLVENLEGFPESIKFLSNPKNWPQAAPLLSDLIYCQPDYRVAIENYLEPYLNYYVVENLAEARNAIGLLGKAQKGKANFFILDEFDRYIPETIVMPGCTQAIERVEVDPKYRNLCHYLLDQVLIFESEHFEQSAYENAGNLSFLSKSGSLIRRSYSLSGGSVGLFEGKKIGRKKNLELLEVEIKSLETETNRILGEIQLQRGAIQLLKSEDRKKEIHEAKEIFSKLGQEKMFLNARLENFEMFLKNVGDKTIRNQEQIVAVQAENARIQIKLDEKRNEANQSKDQISQADQSYRQVADTLSQLSADYNEKNIAFIRQQNKVSSVQRELNYREKQHEETVHSLATSEQTFAHSDAELDVIIKDLDNLEKELTEGYQIKKDREALLTEAEQAYFQSKGSINDLDDQLRKINKQRQDSQILVNQLKESYNDIKMELHSIGERLKVEFNISVNDLINQDPDPSLVREELQDKVERMKNRLDTYGEINPLAVEAYTEMKERFDTISAQRNDILKAKESLLQTIKEIEETATAQFLSAFDTIRSHFIHVFRSLFTEDDSCDLTLMDPDNPLETDIQIIARPKGKRPQTINQLSGGEKTLTATALLFALYLYKPAPFCIFDEVDAPLDDANIEKFNKIIKKFSADSQFIIVTHNKATMAAVDIIYGVHMPEQGVSEVTPVDFRDFEHKTSMQVLN